MEAPTPQLLCNARRDAGLTQTEAGALVHVGTRTWQKWEGGERSMPKASWELFLIKTRCAPGEPVALCEPFRPTGQTDES